MSALPALYILRLKQSENTWTSCWGNFLLTPPCIRFFFFYLTYSFFCYPCTQLFVGVWPYGLRDRWCLVYVCVTGTGQTSSERVWCWIRKFNVLRNESRCLLCVYFSFSLKQHLKSSCSYFTFNPSRKRNSGLGSSWWHAGVTLWWWMEFHLCFSIQWKLTFTKLQLSERTLWLVRIIHRPHYKEF